MAITQAMAIAIAVTGTAVGLASPAWADEQLGGDYTFVNGATTNTWTITTQCNAERTCGGTVSTSTGWVGAISRLAGGPWTAYPLPETVDRATWQVELDRQNLACVTTPTRGRLASIALPSSFIDYSRRHDLAMLI